MSGEGEATVVELQSKEDVSTQTAFAVIAGVAALFVALIVMVFYLMRDKAMSQDIVDVQRRFDAFKLELQQQQQKKMFKYSKGIQDFLKQYKKPILQSAFDLQSRLTNQVKNNFLFSFLQERGGERDKNYALYNFSFVFAEFLGWLEVIRQELVFVTGDDDTPLLASLIDGIKFQLTGETPIQGTPPPGQADNPEFEEQSKIFQLYAGELRSIGSVMINTDADGNKSILNADEFQRLMTVKAPPETSGNEAANIDWARSRERLFQDMMLPLFDHLRHMARLPKGEAPTRRLAIFQVLLCKLIDLIDNAIPYDSGPKYDPMEEVQYITRDFRLTPLVANLNSFQRSWMASQLFMETAEKQIADELWDDHMEGRDPTWRKLCFCGFREDVAHLPQDERDKKPGMWPGACPPKICRTRKMVVDPKSGRGVEPTENAPDGGGNFLTRAWSRHKGSMTRNSSSQNDLMVSKVGTFTGSGRLNVSPSLHPANASSRGGANQSAGKGDDNGPPKGNGSGKQSADTPPLPLAAAKLLKKPETPTSSDTDSSRNSDSPSSGSTHRRTLLGGGPAKDAPGFQAITIPNAGGDHSKPSHAPEAPTQTGQLLPPLVPPTSTGGHHSRPEESNAPDGLTFAGTGIASSAVLQRPNTRPLHPLQAAAVAHHQAQQEQQQEQKQLQEEHPERDVHKSLPLPPSASPFHNAHTPTRTGIPAMRKWGSQQSRAGQAATNNNRISPMPERQAFPQEPRQGGNS